MSGPPGAAEQAHPSAQFVTKKEYVALRLREMIVSGQMPPGTRIRQLRLAVQLGISATPVREAIRQLETEGYLQSRPHVGASVREINREGLEEIYHVRSMLEGWLAREAATRMTDADLAELRALCDQFSLDTRRGDHVAARRANYRLHRLVWERAEQPTTLEIVNTLWAKFPWDTLNYVPGRPERTVREHEDLFAALRARDPDKAEAALREHIASGRRDYFASVAGARSAAGDGGRPQLKSDEGATVSGGAQVGSR